MSTRYRFGEFELDTARNELRRAGEPVELLPTPLRLLHYLISHRDRAVPKIELLDALWPDAVVSESALTSALKHLRKALGDDGTRQELVRTQRRLGIRFVADVEEEGAAPPVSARSAAAAPYAQPGRRLAAVLTADAVGFRRLIEEDEARTLAELESARARIASLVDAGGGRLVDAVGDTVLAEFPSALLAIEAASAIQQPDDASARLRFRIGVHLGEVFSDGQLLHGDAVNVAARLERLAPAGGICASAAVADAVRGRVDLDWEDAGEHTLKNVERPLQVFRHPPSADGGDEPSRSRAAPEPAPGARIERFVGRADALSLAARELEDAAAGQGCALFLDGEAGIGKTALALEIARVARGHGFGVHLGRCLEEAGAPAYWPWTQVLRSVLDGRTPEQLPAGWRQPLVDAGPLLEGAGGPAQAGVAADGPGLRFRLFDAVAQILGAAARERPRLIVLDDLHRADASSLLLLKRVLDELPTAGVFLVGTYRGGEVEPSSTLARLASESGPWVTRHALRGLAPPDVETLLERTAHARPTAEVTEAVLERTLGNPLFVEEVGRALAAEGLAGAEAAARVQRLAPEGVRQAIANRVSRLPSEAQSALEAAAAIGREFDLDVLARAIEASAERAAQALDPALSIGLVDEIPDRTGRLRFSHILARDALYAGLPRSRRAQLHGRVGDALEALRAQERDAHLDELANHFLNALDEGGAPRAVRYARRAGERDLASAAYEEAAENFEAALGASSRLGEEEARRVAAELRVLLGQAHWRAGAPAAARDAFGAAIDAARAADDAETLARAALGWAGRTDAGQGANNPAALALLEEALAGLPEADGALRSEVLARLGTELYASPEWRRGRELAESAVAMAERLGEQSLLAYNLTAQRYTWLRPDVEPARRLAVGARTVELAQRFGPPDALALALQEDVLDHLALGDGARFDAALDRFGRNTEALRQPFFLWMHSGFVGARALLSGRVAEAEALAQQTLARGQAFETPNAGLLYAAQLFLIRLEQGRLPDLLPMFEAAASAQPELTALRTALTYALSAAGRDADARAALEGLAAHGFDDFAYDEHWTTALTTLVEPAVAVGEPDVVSRLYELLAPLAGTMVVVAHGAGCHGAVNHHLGRLAAAGHDSLSAEEHLEAAAAEHRRLGAPLWTAHSEAALSLLLWKTGDPGERDRARTLAEQSRKAYAGFGVEHHTARLADVPR